MKLRFALFTLLVVGFGHLRLNPYVRLLPSAKCLYLIPPARRA